MSNDNNEGQEINPVLPGSNGEVTGTPSGHRTVGRPRLSPRKSSQRTEPMGKSRLGRRHPKGRRGASGTASNTASLLGSLSPPGRRVTCCGRNIMIWFSVSGTTTNR